MIVWGGLLYALADLLTWAWTRRVNARESNRKRSAKPWSRLAGCYVQCAQTTDFHALRALTTSVRSDQHGLPERLRATDMPLSPNGVEGR